LLDAAALLRRYAATELLAEHLAWEALRSALAPAPYRPPRDIHAKTLLVLDGIPGAGKSTTHRWLAPAIGGTFFSMARFAEARGVSSNERIQHQLAHRRPHPVDCAFLAALDACPARHTLIEKFPRSPVEAAALLTAAGERAWRIEVLHLDLPGDCVDLSIKRQIARGPRWSVDRTTL
jgi:hypothetical protein